MHPYTTTETRVLAQGLLAVVAVGVSWAIVWITSPLDWPQWLVSAPSLAGVYAVLYQLMDKGLWTRSLMRTLRLSCTPDLTGTYTGSLTSTYPDASGSATIKDVNVEIRQSWTRIRIVMTVGQQAGSSTSRSVTAAVVPDDDSVALTYAYRNEVNPGVADADMGDHSGTAELALASDGKLSGRYYNARGRAGSLELRRTRHRVMP